MLSASSVTGVQTSLRPRASPRSAIASACARRSGFGCALPFPGSRAGPTPFWTSAGAGGAVRIRWRGCCHTARGMKTGPDRAIGEEGGHGAVGLRDRPTDKWVDRRGRCASSPPVDGNGSAAGATAEQTCGSSRSHDMPDHRIVGMCGHDQMVDASSRRQPRQGRISGSTGGGDHQQIRCRVPQPRPVSDGSLLTPTPARGHSLAKGDSGQTFGEAQDRQAAAEHLRE